MSDLSAYPNVYNTALVLIQKKGFAVTYDRDPEHWYAQKKEWKFLADDPIQLLGLVSIYEYSAPTEKSEYWWKIDSPDLLSQLDPEK
jgi:hypothetical protein